MSFPWELNLERPYRDKDWPLHEELAQRDSTDSGFGGSTEKLDGFPADNEPRQGTAKAPIRRTPARASRGG
jgi:hypothetical protein